MGCVTLGLAAPFCDQRLIMLNRTFHYCACVGLGLIPAAHWIWEHPSAESAVAIQYLLAMFGCYGVGAIFYVTKWPECQWPGIFDIIGHSHQVWHVFVVLAAVSWIRGCAAIN